MAILLNISAHTSGKDNCILLSFSPCICPPCSPHASELSSADPFFWLLRTPFTNECPPHSGGERVRNYWINWNTFFFFNQWEIHPDSALLSWKIPRQNSIKEQTVLSLNPEHVKLAVNSQALNPEPRNASFLPGPRSESLWNPTDTTSSYEMPTLH